MRDAKSLKWHGIVLCLLVFMTVGCETTMIRKTEVVQGKVIDADTKKPIAGARVMFLDRLDTLVYTDSRGRFMVGPGYMHVPIELGFQLTLAPETRLKIQAEGYETKIFQAYPRVEWTQKSQMKESKFKIICLTKKQ